MRTERTGEAKSTNAPVNVIEAPTQRAMPGLVSAAITPASTDETSIASRPPKRVAALTRPRTRSGAVAWRRLTALISYTVQPGSLMTCCATRIADGDTERDGGSAEDEHDAGPAHRHAEDHRAACAETAAAPVGRQGTEERGDTTDAVDQPLHAGREAEVTRDVDHEHGAEHAGGGGVGDPAQGEGAEDAVVDDDAQALDDSLRGRSRARAAGAGSGSGLRIRRSDAAEKRNETASTAIAPGAVTICTSQPAMLKAPNSATEALAVSLLLPSTSCSGSIERRQVRLVGDIEERGEDAREEGDGVELLDPQLAHQRGDGHGRDDGGAAEVGGDHDRALAQAVDPDAGEQREGDAGEHIGRGDEGYLERRSVQVDDGGERQGDA